LLRRPGEVHPTQGSRCRGDPLTGDRNRALAQAGIKSSSRFLRGDGILLCPDIPHINVALTGINKTYPFLVIDVEMAGTNRVMKQAIRLFCAACAVDVSQDEERDKHDRYNCNGFLAFEA